MSYVYTTISRFVVRSVRFFFFNDTATPEIYTLSLHDALPISEARAWSGLEGLDLAKDASCLQPFVYDEGLWSWPDGDRKSTRLNSSHLVISYAVFCLKKKKQLTSTPATTDHPATSP